MGSQKIASVVRFAASCGAILAMLGGGLFVGGCATAPVAVPAAATASPAHLAVINQTDYEWRIVIAHSSSAPAYDGKVQPRATVMIDLPGGDYLIEQTVLSAEAGPGLTRKIPSKLESGQTYRWRLVTLLSEPTGL